MKNILIINFGGIGDEILFLPVISSLKKEFKDSKITLCLEKRSRAIADLTSLVNNFICVDIKKNKFKKIFELFKMLFEIRKHKFDIALSSGKSPLVAILLFLTGAKRRIGYRSKTAFLLTDKVDLNENQYASFMYHDIISPLTNLKCELPKIELNESESINCILPNNFLNDGFIALHPGVSKMSLKKGIYKCPEENFWTELIKKLIERGENVALLGGVDDKEIIEKISKKITKDDKFLNLFGMTQNIQDMARVISKAERLICVDSAPMHIGVALNKNVSAIFGPTNEEKLLPKTQNFKAIYRILPCRPCLWHRLQKNCEHSDCLNIDIDDVILSLE